MDKRKNNGGNSTKSKGSDKRKNDFKQAINDAFDTNDVIKVLTSLKSLAVNEGDIQAAKVFLEYTAGKPATQMDITTGGNEINIAPITWVQTDEDK